MKITHIAVAFLALLAPSTATVHAAIAFKDTFRSSTLNAAIAGIPSPTSTNYAVLSTRNATASSIAAGALKLASAPTASALTELQARFAASPLTLVADNDYVELRATFVPVGINYVDTNFPASFNVGLFNSHGAAPVTGGQMNNAQLNATDTNFAVGFAAGWEGYATRIQPELNQIYTRPAQSDATNESQDLLFNNAATGAFDTPTGVTLQPLVAMGVVFENNATYTYRMRLMKVANEVFMSQEVRDGADLSGPILLYSSAISTASTPTMTFDGFAIGFRSITDTFTPVSEHSLTFSLIEVTTNLPVPEPGGAALLAAACVAVCRASCRRHGRMLRRDHSHPLAAQQS